VKLNKTVAREFNVGGNLAFTQAFIREGGRFWFRFIFYGEKYKLVYVVG